MRRILLLSISALIALAALSCKKDNTVQEPDPEYPPMLNETVVNLSNVLSVKSYGETIGLRLRRSSIRYFTDNGLTEVISVSVGTVDSVSYNSNAHNQDYRVRIRPFKNSLWYVIYNHVAQVTVKVGDPVTAGTVLGRVGSGDIVDLQINKVAYESSGVKFEVSICPEMLFHSSIETAHSQMKTRLGITGRLCSSGPAIPYYSEPWR